MITTDITVLASRRFDVCVVGGGPVGLSLAIDLIGRGLSVLVLESGLAKRGYQFQSLSDAVIATPEQHLPMSLAVSRALGGTSHLWGGRCIPLDEVDFLDRPYIANSGWPISYGTFAKYQTRASELIGCDDGDFVAANGYSSPDIEFNTLERWVNETRILQLPNIAQDERIVVLLNATAIEMRFESGSRTVTGLRVAREGQEATFSAATFYVLALGGVENARFLLNAQCEHPLLFGGKSGPLGRYYMGHISGSWTQIKFNSQAGTSHFRNLRGAKSFARRRLTIKEHVQIENEIPNIAFWPENLELSNADHHSGTLSLVHLLLSAPRLGQLIVSEAIRKTQVQNQSGYGMHLRNILRNFGGLSGGVADLLWQRLFYKRRLPRLELENPSGFYRLHFHAEQVPVPGNRIRAVEQRDRLGLRRVKIELHPPAAELPAIIKAHEILHRALKVAGLGQLAGWEILDPHAELKTMPDGLHQIGSTRMSNHRSTGVVDSDCRTFDFENLYIAGSSVFPTSGQATPTLPAIALAVRLSEHIAQQAAATVVLSS